MKKVIWILLFISSISLYSQNGTLDSSFGNFGKKIIVFDSINSDAFGSVKLAKDENYLVMAILDKLGGPTSLTTRLFKLDRTGAFISGFGNGGFIKPEVEGKPFLPFNYTEFPNGTFRFYSPDYLVQYQKNGLPDLNFGNNGIIKLKNPNDFGYSGGVKNIIELAGGGYVCLAGVNIDFLPRIMLYKLHPTGSLVTQFPDSAFHIISEKFNGVTLNRANIITDQYNQIYLYGEGYHGTKGYCLFVLKFKENGSIDKSYGDQGMFTIYGIRYDSESTFAQADSYGNVYLFGSSTTPTASHYVVKISPQGQTDPSFNQTGSIIQNLTPSFDPRSMLLFADQGFVLGGRSRLVPGTDPKHSLVFYNKTGKIDSSYGINGVLTTRFNPSFGNLDSRCDVLIRDREMSFVSSGRTIEGGYDAIVLTRHKIRTNIPSNVGIKEDLNFIIMDSGNQFIIKPGQEGTFIITLTDIYGRSITNQKIIGEQCELQKPVPGYYILSISNGRLKSSKKMVVN